MRRKETRVHGEGMPATLSARRLASVLIVVPMLALSAPARAGSEADPEIMDPCGAESPIYHQRTESLDICSGWFRGLWRLVPSQDDPRNMTWAFDGLEATLSLAGGVEDRPDFAQYSMWWRFDGCRESWVFWGYLDSEEWKGRFSHLFCQDERKNYSVALPAEHVSVGPDRITVRLMLSDELAPIADRFVLGRGLEQPDSQTDLNFETSQRSDTIGGWDTTASGRTFFIGQDRPPDPAG